MNADAAPKLKSDAGLESPWAAEYRDVLEALSVDADKGLSSEEVTARQEKFGLNILTETKHRSLTAILYDQLKSILVLLLVIAAGPHRFLYFGEYVEGFAILAVVVINTIIGFVMELKALHSMEALKTLTDVEVTV